MRGGVHWGLAAVGSLPALWLLCEHCSHFHFSVCESDQEGECTAMQGKRNIA